MCHDLYMSVPGVDISILVLSRSTLRLLSPERKHQYLPDKIISFSSSSRGHQGSSKQVLLQGDMVGGQWGRVRWGITGSGDINYNEAVTAPTD